MRNWRWWPAVALVLGAIVYWRIRDLALVGLDTLPILATADVTGFLFERLMPDHNMWRPVLSLTVAVDEILYWTTARGFQRTNALVYTGMGLAIGFAAKRLTGSPRAALVALLALMLHASLIDVIPAVERRSEMLMILFLALAVGAQVKAVRVPELSGSGRPLAPTFLALLAMGSKDNGAIVLPLLLTVGYLYADGERRARLRQAFWVTAPTFLATGIFLAWRGQLVGGLGGRADRDPTSLIFRHPRLVPAMIDRVLRPEPFASLQLVTTLLVVAALVAVGLAWYLGREGGRERGSEGDAEPRALSNPARTALVGLVWIELAMITYASRGVWRLWYVTLLAAGYALVLAACVEMLSARLGNERARRPALAALALIAASVAWQAQHTVAFGPLDPWHERTAIMNDFYGELHERIDSSRRGGIVECPEIPDKIATPPGPHFDDVRDITKTTIRAFCVLAFPRRPARLRPPERAGVREGDGFVLTHPSF